MKTVYLAGKISGDPYYFSKFYEATKTLEEAGFAVLHGARLPGKGFTWDQYMRITWAMLEECEAVCMLPDWKESRGAAYEYGQAVAQDKEIFYFAEWLEAQKKTIRIVEIYDGDGNVVEEFAEEIKEGVCAE